MKVKLEIEKVLATDNSLYLISSTKVIEIATVTVAGLTIKGNILSLIGKNITLNVDTGLSSQILIGEVKVSCKTKSITVYEATKEDLLHALEISIQFNIN